MIVSMTMVQSEADILEYFVRCAVMHVDYMVIVANPSEDGSCEILNQLAKEGLPIIVWKSQVNVYAQQSMFTSLVNRIRDQLNPDFIVPLDADEIILTRNGLSFSDALDQIPDNNIGYLGWSTFVPPRKRFNISRLHLTAEDNKHSIIDGSRWHSRLRNELLPIKKIAIPSHVRAGRPIRVPNGYHALYDENDAQVAGVEMSGVTLAHLPVRSAYQIKQKTMSSIINKGIADGAAWWGVESFQLEQMLSYFERNEKSYDIRYMAQNYLRQDWSKSEAPDLVQDEGLPRMKLKYKDLVVSPAPEIGLCRRVMASIFPEDDPTSVLRAGIQSQDAAETQPEGIFSSAFHFQNLCCDWPPFGMVLDKFEPKSVLDIGCGLGAYLRIFRERGTRILGVDGSEHTDLHFIGASEYRAVDMENEQIALHENFDLSICVEVLEHLDEDPALGIVDLLAKSTRKVIVFSAAQPDQPGYAHKTLRRPEFWLDRFAAAGWSVDVSSSVAVRILSTLHWFRRNLFVLVPSGQGNARFRDKLFEIGVHRDSLGGTTWRSHRVGETIIGYPGQNWAMTMDCSEELPPLANAVRPQGK